MAVFKALLLLYFTTWSNTKIISFKKNALQGVTSKPAFRKWTAQSTEHCAQACAGLPECLSFSVQADLQECSLFSSRISALDITATSAGELETFYTVNRPRGSGFHNASTIIQETGKHVGLETNRLNWTQAQTKCEAERGQLLIIEDMVVLEAVRDFLAVTAPSTASIFVGGGKHDTGEWLWLDGSPVEASLWHAGQPSLDNQYCMQLWKSNDILLLDNTHCKFSLTFLCEA